MALGKRKPQQEELFIPRAKVAAGPGHPFYSKLNEVLAQAGFDEFVEKLCAPYYKEGGRPGIPPGVYFRMVLIGYFEGLDSQRGIAWRCADSLGLRTFLGIAITEDTPVHASMTIIRQRLPESVFDKVFVFVLSLLEQKGLLRGKAVAIDATTLEANAAMRSIVRRDNGASYDEFLQGLAQESGIATPTREDLARLDRKRKKKGANKEWTSPQDADARITRMKDGSTHLAHKAEHAVDMETGAVLAVTLQPADQGDTTTMVETLAQAGENVADLIAREAAEPEPGVNLAGIEEVVTDKGYHSGPALVAMKAAGVRTYIPEKKQPGKRHWIGKKDEQQAVYANRQRVSGNHGKSLLRKPGELIERSFAHCYETGAMRRTHLRGHENILKRQLIHVGAFNLSLIFRALIGAGTPRELKNRLARLVFVLEHLLASLRQPNHRSNPAIHHRRTFQPPNCASSSSFCRHPKRRGSATGC